MTPPEDLTPIQKFAAWCGGAVVVLISIVVLVGLLERTLSPAVAIGALTPIALAVISGLLIGATKPPDKGDKS